jgi:hypothetical protein
MCQMSCENMLNSLELLIIQSDKNCQPKNFAPLSQNFVPREAGTNLLLPRA